MSRLRNRWMTSLTSALLALSVLVLALGPVLTPVEADDVVSARATWLRAYVHHPDDAEVRTALDHAAEVEASTLRAFVEAFVQAYSGVHAQADLSTLFTVQGSTVDAVVDALLSHHERLSVDGLLSHLVVATAHVPTQVQERLKQFFQSYGIVAPVRLARVVRDLKSTRPQRLGVIPCFLLSSAQPLGP